MVLSLVLLQQVPRNITGVTTALKKLTANSKRRYLQEPKLDAY